MLSQARAKGLDTSAVEVVAKKAEEYLQAARDYFRGGNYVAANFFALEAIDMYEEALETLKNMFS